MVKQDDDNPKPVKKRPPSHYELVIEMFMANGAEVVELDLDNFRGALGKPDLKLASIRQGLRAAVERLNLEGAVAIGVSVRDGDESLWLRRKTPPQPSPLDGLEIRGDFVSITTEEWEERFRPLREDGNDYYRSYDTHERGDQDFVLSQPADRIWTEVQTEEGTAIHNGYQRVDRLGYYVTEVPCPEDITVQVWDEPWGDGGEEFIRSGVAAWQREFGFDEDSIAEDAFQSWFERTYPENYKLVDVDLNPLLSSRLELELFESIGEYHDLRLAKGEPSRSERGLVERSMASFARATQTEQLDAAIDAFLEDAGNVWLFTTSADDGFRGDYDLKQELYGRLLDRHLRTFSSVYVEGRGALLRQRD